ncbi:MAG: hypothetical protein IJX79_04075 [Clostridia bacterium]|nr:hypothetical protein [Clostridia bacterium]
MEQNVFKAVALNNNVSEEDVRNEIVEALKLAEGVGFDKEMSLEEIVAFLAKEVIEAMEA